MKLAFVVMYYLDPGSGSMLVQLLIAALMGAAFLLKTFWRRIAGLFQNKNRAQNQDLDAEDQ